MRSTSPNDKDDKDGQETRGEGEERGTEELCRISPQKELRRPAVTEVTTTTVPIDMRGRMSLGGSVIQQMT